MGAEPTLISVWPRGATDCKPRRVDPCPWQGVVRLKFGGCRVVPPDINRRSGCCFGLFEQVEVLVAGLHGMDDELVAEG